MSMKRRSEQIRQYFIKEMQIRYCHQCTIILSKKKAILLLKDT